MDSTVLIPLLFPMEQGFEDIHDGGLIRVSGLDRQYVGTLHVTRLAAPARFGVILQFGPSEVTGSPAPTSCGDGGFTTTGHSGLQTHRLTLEELRRIVRTGDSRMPFALDVPSP